MHWTLKTSWIICWRNIISLSLSSKEGCEIFKCLSRFVLIFHRYVIICDNSIRITYGYSTYILNALTCVSSLMLALWLNVSLQVLMMLQDE